MGVILNWSWRNRIGGCELDISYLLINRFLWQNFQFNKIKQSWIGLQKQVRKSTLFIKKYYWTNYLLAHFTDFLLILPSLKLWSRFIVYSARHWLPGLIVQFLLIFISTLHSICYTITFPVSILQTTTNCSLFTVCFVLTFSNKTFQFLFVLSYVRISQFLAICKWRKHQCT